jgi:hypothetical protein
MGALLTILAIGIDSSMQQTLVGRQRMTESNLPASIPLAQGYIFCEFTWQYGYTDMIYVPPVAMVGAMYSGIVREPDATQHDDVAPLCPTSNCTFPPFQSLAIGHRCEDVTEFISTNCTTYNRTVPFAKIIRHCHLKLPNGLAVNHTTGNFDQWFTLYPTALASSAWLPPVKKEVNSGAFASMTLLKSTHLGNWTVKATATQCSLFWCVNTYQSSVSNGRVSENITESWQPPDLNFSDRETTSGCLPLRYLDSPAQSLWLLGRRQPVCSFGSAGSSPSARATPFATTHHISVSSLIFREIGLSSHLLARRHALVARVRAS